MMAAGWPKFVFPTRVGMVRRRVRNDPRHSRFPHARGDGPAILAHVEDMDLFSPRAWGWSGKLRALRGYLLVFPTRVGMVRNGTT